MTSVSLSGGNLVAFVTIQNNANSEHESDNFESAEAEHDEREHVQPHGHIALLQEYRDAEGKVKRWTLRQNGLFYTENLPKFS